jgi:hypothetical protein
MSLRDFSWPPDRRRIALSETAMSRYAARARPDLPREEAIAELRWRARHGVLKRRRPGWVDGDEGRGLVLGFLLLVTAEPEVALPLVVNPDGRVVATTAKVRGWDGRGCSPPVSVPDDAITGPRARGELPSGGRATRTTDFARGDSPRADRRDTMGLDRQEIYDREGVARAAGETPLPDPAASLDVGDDRSRMNGCDGCALQDLRLS